MTDRPTALEARHDQRRPDPVAASAPPQLPFRTFGPILGVHFLGTLGFSLAIPFLVFIVADLGGANWTYGLVGATYSGCQFFGAPVLGRWSDRFGRRPVLVVSQVGTLIAWLLFLLALSLPVEAIGALGGATITVPLLLVFAARALDGATGGNISVANAMVADLTRTRPELRDLAFGRMGMAASLGFVLGPAAAGLLGTTSWGPRLPIAIAALFALLTTIAIVAFLPEPRGRCPDGPPAPGALSGLHQQARPCDREPPAIDPGRGARRAQVLRMMVATFLLFVAFNFFYAGFPVHAAERLGWSTGQLGGFFAVLSLMMMFAQGPLLAFATRRLPRRTVFAIGLSLLTMALAGLRWLDADYAYGSAVLFAFGNGLAWPTFQARVAEVGGDDQGSVQGAVTSASSLASILGLIVGGALYPQFGAGIFLLAAAVFAAVAALTPRWFR